MAMKYNDAQLEIIKMIFNEYEKSLINESFSPLSSNDIFDTIDLASTFTAFSIPSSTWISNVAASYMKQLNQI